MNRSPLPAVLTRRILAVGTVCGMLGVSLLPRLGACTPQKRDRVHATEGWCCCDANYQRCALFGDPGKGDGRSIYFMEVNTDEWCDGNGNAI